MASELIERRNEEGGVVELWRRDDHYDVIVDGRTVLSSERRRGEESMSELALAPWQGRDDITVLVGGLGMGQLVRAFLQSPAVARIDVVEASQAIIDWERQYFTDVNGGATKDRRVHVHHGELSEWLRGGAAMNVLRTGWMVFAVDTDEWPDLSRPGNWLFYGDEGISLLESGLRPGGVLVMWAKQRDDALLRRMHARLQNVIKIAVPVELGGESSLDYVYRGRRPPPAQTAGAGGMPN
jgi:spermidine synthase